MTFCEESTHVSWFVFVCESFPHWIVNPLLSRTMGQKRKKQIKQPSKHPLSHERGSEQSERGSKQVSAAERASEASSAEQAND